MILDLYSSCDDVNKPSTKITLDSHHYLSLTFTLLHGICKEQRKEVFNLNSFVLVYPLFFNFFRITVVKKKEKRKSVLIGWDYMSGRCFLRLLNSSQLFWSLVWELIHLILVMNLCWLFPLTLNIWRTETMEIGGLFYPYFLYLPSSMRKWVRYVI